MAVRSLPQVAEWGESWAVIMSDSAIYFSFAELKLLWDNSAVCAL